MSYFLRFLFVFCKVKGLRYRICKICLLYFIWAAYKCGCRFISHTNNLNICNGLSKLKKGEKQCYLLFATKHISLVVWNNQYAHFYCVMNGNHKIYIRNKYDNTKYKNKHKRCSQFCVVLRIRSEFCDKSWVILYIKKIWYWVLLVSYYIS